MRIADDAKLEKALAVLDGDTSGYKPAKLAELRAAVDTYLNENSPIPELSGMAENFDRVEENVQGAAVGGAQAIAENTPRFGRGPKVSDPFGGAGRPTPSMDTEDTSQADPSLRPTHGTRPGRTQSIQDLQEPSEELGARPEMAPPPEKPKEQEQKRRFDAEGNLIEEEPPEWLYKDSTARNLSGDSRFDAPIGHYGGSWVNARVAYEPSVEYVKDVLRGSRNLQRTVGLEDAVDINGVDSESDAYKRACDAIWMMRLEEAKAADYPLLRASQQPSDSLLKGPLGSVLEYAITPASQAVLNFERGAAGGVLTNLAAGAVGGDEMQRQMAELRDTAHPGISIPSQFAGALAPWSAPSIMARSGMGMVRAAPITAGAQESASLLPRMLQSGAVGAGVGLGAGAMNDAADIDAGLIQPSQFGEHAVSDMLWGGTLGAGFEGLGSLASRTARRIQEANPDIIRIEKAGGVVNAMSSSLPKRLTKLVDAHMDEWHGADKRITPQERAVGLVEGRFVDAGRKYLADTVRPIEKVKEAYYLTPQGQARQSMRPLWEFTLKTLQGMKRDMSLRGQDLPANDTSGLRTMMADMSNGRLGKGSVGGQPGKIKTRFNQTTKQPELELSSDDAELLFGKEWVQRVHESTGPWTGEGRPVILVSPMEGDARAVDTIVNGMFSAAKRAVKGNSSLDESLIRELGAKARETRDGFKGNAVTGNRKWSEVMREASEEIGGAKDLLGNAGLRRDKSMYTDVDMKKLRDHIAGFWTGEKRAKADEALMFLAERAGMVQELKDVAGVVARSTVNQPGVASMVTPTVAQTGTRAAVHPSAGLIGRALYPPLRALGSSLDSGAGAVQNPYELPKYAADMATKAGMLHGMGGGKLPKIPELKLPKGLAGLLFSMRGGSVPTGRMVGRLGAAARPDEALQQAKEDMENLQIVLDVADKLRELKEETSQ